MKGGLAGSTVVGVCHPCLACKPLGGEKEQENRTEPTNSTSQKPENNTLKIPVLPDQRNRKERKQSKDVDALG